MGSSLQVFVVEVAEIVRHEAHEPDSVPHLRHPDILPGEDVTEIHLAAIETDASAVCHGEGLVMQGVRARSSWDNNMIFPLRRSRIRTSERLPGLTASRSEP
jgi:hypothetical protein